MSQTNTQHHTIHPPMFNLAAIALILIMLGLGIAYWLNAYARPQPQQTTSTFASPTVSKILAETELQIPQNWQNPQTRLNDKIIQFLDLKLFVRFTPGAELTPINLHLAPSRNGEPSSHMLDTVYSLRFTPRQAAGPMGLIGKPLKAEEGFENETVWYDPLSANPFVAKCISLGTEKPTATCLRTVQISPKMLVTYQFSADQLQYWREFDGVMEPLLTQIGIKA